MYWIKNAIKKPGALHKELGVAAGKKIPKEKLEKAAHKGGKLGKRARLAETLEGMHHGKKHHDKHEKHEKKAKKSEVKHHKKDKIKKVMHEFKEHALHSGSKKGPVVSNPKQAIAIALSESRKVGKKHKK
jgi:hypothetical protein